jgi:hypothetical protein
MTKLSKLTITELAATICESLLAEGVQATLSGGACAEIYSSRKYVTGDLDFVVNYISPDNRVKIEKVMTKLGFKNNGRIFINPTIAYSVEFPPGPLGIGDEYKVTPVEMQLATGRLFLLSATDCVKDRLTGYFYGNDAQCLEQAVMICQMNKTDLENIRTWAKREGCLDKLQEFERKIKI